MDGGSVMNWIDKLDPEMDRIMLIKKVVNGLRRDLFAIVAMHAFIAKSAYVTSSIPEGTALFVDSFIAELDKEDKDKGKGKDKEK